MFLSECLKKKKQDQLSHSSHEPLQKTRSRQQQQGPSSHRTFSSSGGGYYRLPIIVAQSLGGRAKQWIQLQHEKCVYAARHPSKGRSCRASSASLLEEMIDGLDIAADSPEYKVHPSPQLKLPYHLRNDSRIVRKVYVPHRGSKLSNGHTHYAVPKGRPVPLPLELIEPIVNKRRNLPRRWLSRKVQSSYDTPRKIPEYLIFTKSCKSKRNSLSRQMRRCSSVHYELGIADIEYNIVRRQSTTCDEDGRGGGNETSSSDGGYISDSDNVASTNCCSGNNKEAASRTTSCDDNNCLNFSVHNSNLSPKIREVVAKLQAKSACSLSNSNTSSSGTSNVSNLNNNKDSVFARHFNTTGRQRKCPHSSNITRSCRDVGKQLGESRNTPILSSSSSSSSSSGTSCSGIFRAVPLRWSCHNLLQDRVPQPPNSPHLISNQTITSVSSPSTCYDSVGDLNNSRRSSTSNLSSEDLKESRSRLLSISLSDTDNTYDSIECEYERIIHRNCRLKSIGGLSKGSTLSRSLSSLDVANNYVLPNNVTSRHYCIKSSNTAHLYSSVEFRPSSPPPPPPPSLPRPNKPPSPSYRTDGVVSHSPPPPAQPSFLHSAKRVHAMSRLIGSTSFRAAVGTLTNRGASETEGSSWRGDYRESIDDGGGYDVISDNNDEVPSSSSSSIATLPHNDNRTATSLTVEEGAEGSTDRSIGGPTLGKTKSRLRGVRGGGGGEGASSTSSPAPLSTGGAPPPPPPVFKLLDTKKDHHQAWTAKVESRPSSTTDSIASSQSSSSSSGRSRLSTASFDHHHHHQQQPSVHRLPLPPTPAPRYTSDDCVTLSDGEKVALTPLYRSLLQKEYFFFATRNDAIELLTKEQDDGVFLIRPSTKHLTLSLLFDGQVKNIPIRQRSSDKCFALGSQNKKVFVTVDDLVEYYKEYRVDLTTGGHVLLSHTPGGELAEVYVKIPMGRGSSH